MIASVPRDVLQLGAEIQAATAQEEQFCRSDVLYALLMHPHEERRTRRVLEGILELVQRKCAPSLDHSTLFHNTKRYLLSDDADGDVRVFCFLMLLRQFEDIREFVRRSLRPGSLWGDQAEQQLGLFVTYMENLSERVLHWPTTEANEAAVVRDFVDAAQLAYPTGTYH